MGSTVVVDREEAACCRVILTHGSHEDVEADASATHGP